MIFFGWNIVIFWNFLNIFYKFYEKEISEIKGENQFLKKLLEDKNKKKIENKRNINYI